MRRSLLLALAGLCAATPVLADETDSLPNFAEDTLTGDWNGARSAAAAKGVVFEGTTRVDSFRNRGAMSNGTRTVSHLDLKMKIDLGKAAGWQGASAMVNVLSDSGWGPNARHVGSLMGVTNLEVGAPTTTRLFQAWLQQNFLDDRLSVLAGIYPIDTEFFAIDSAAVFMSPPYGPPAELSTTRGPSIFNNAAFGIRARLQSADQSRYAMWAMVDGIPNDPARPRATAIRFAKGDGAFNIGELGWLPQAGNDKFQGHAKVAAGLWYYTARVDDLVATDVAGNPARRRSHGGYVLGEATLARLGGDDSRYLTGFARYGWTDGDSTSLKNSTSIGVHVRGPVESRPDDIIGLAWTRAGVAQKWRATQVAGTTASTEEAVEATYHYAISPWLAIQPNYQYIRNPGGSSTLPAAKLIGIRLEVVL